MVSTAMFGLQFFGLPVLAALLLAAGGVVLLTRLGERRTTRVVVAVVLLVLAVALVASPAMFLVSVSTEGWLPDQH